MKCLFCNKVDLESNSCDLVCDNCSDKDKDGSVIYTYSMSVRINKILESMRYLNQ